LAHAFHNLFDMASEKKAWVSSQIQENNWALTFRHSLSQQDFRCWQLLYALSKDTFFKMTWIRSFGRQVPPLASQFVLSTSCCNLRVHRILHWSIFRRWWRSCDYIRL